MYRYIHNLQGDVVAIVDTTGIPVVEYRYDAWGIPISTTGSLKTSLGELNPFRYRGYVWDEETELYFLRNRYFNTKHCRFIDMDVLIERDSLIKNVFSYCNNAPTMLLDLSGE